MIIESLDSTVEQVFFWLGVVGGSLSLLFLLAVEVNRKGVFQSTHGNKSLQNDKAVGTAMITTILSVISLLHH